MNKQEQELEQVAGVTRRLVALRKVAHKRVLKYRTMEKEVRFLRHVTSKLQALVDSMRKYDEEAPKADLDAPACADEAALKELAEEGDA